MKYDGIGIALAWPQTPCKGTGAWYDPLMRAVGICDENYFYSVGHAAVLLISQRTGGIHYFDFGRYETPDKKYGRVRDASTDAALTVQQQAAFDAAGNLLNLHTILKEISARAACNGKGSLVASTVPLNFTVAFQKAKALQKQGLIPYGPFVWSGTNCSRFVRRVLLAGNPSWLQRSRLLFPPTITPTPRYLVCALGAICRVSSHFPVLDESNQSNKSNPSNKTLQA